jgi:hypothetical protein
VLLYVKSYYRYLRRHDLEIQGVECIWVEIVSKTKRFLYGTYYRPPNTSTLQHSLIEDSINLAVDSGIPNIIITGDFNINMLNSTASRKLISLSQQLSLTQLISEPTHFTESSNSLIDIILTSNPLFIYTVGVGEPCLDQPVRYHCPVFGLINFNKPNTHTYTRHIWLFDKGNYQQLRELAASTNWHQFKDQSIDIYAHKITEAIIDISKISIPNRNVTIRPNDPPWFPPNLKILIRQRRRYYKKAKRTNTEHDWLQFRTLRNNIVSKINISKANHIQNLANNLKTSQQNTKSWWSCLKSFIKPCSSSSIPPLQNGDILAEDEKTKADILNDFFY